MKLIFTILSALLLTCSVAYAVPAYRTPITVAQADGSTLIITKVGDERSHSYITKDGLAVEKGTDGSYYYQTSEGISKELAHDSESRSVSEKSYISSMGNKLEWGTFNTERLARKKSNKRNSVMQKSQVPHEGSPKVLVLLVQFSDKKFKDTDPIAIYENEMNGAGESVKEYFKKQSYSKFDPIFDVKGVVTLANKYSYYGANDSYGNDLRPGEMIKDACNAINSQINFADYDNDKDGNVDVAYVIYAGEGEASSDDVNTVWPHQWDLVSAIGSSLVLDGVTINKYACGNELRPSGSLDGIGTFCHEFSHCLGLPDFYTTVYNDAYGMNKWSLMDYGCYNNSGNTPVSYIAYEREFLGWLEIETLNTMKTVTLECLADGGKAYRIQSPYNVNEYYLLENRQQTNGDQYLDSHGLMITHVDYDANVWANNTVNNVVSHQRMTIFPADNKLTEATNSGDLYPNGGKNTELTDESTPAATLFKGSFMSQPITSITENNGVISLKYGTIAPPVMNDATEVGTTSFTASWTPVEDAASYTLFVKKASKVSDEPVLAEDFDKFIVKSSDIGSSLDTYMNNPGWQGEILYGELKALRFGTSKAVGYLLSPSLDFSGSDVVTVQFTAKSYGSDGDVTFYVGTASESEDYLLDTATFTVGAKETTQYAVLSIDNVADGYIQMENAAIKKRVNMTDFKLYVGDLSEMMAANGYTEGTKEEAPARKAKGITKSGKNRIAKAAEDETLITGITATNYNVSGLEKGGTYSYKVKAVFADASETSYSNTVKVMLESSGVEGIALASQLKIEGNRVTILSDEPSAIYSVMGIKMSEQGNNTYTLNNGVYIVRIGDKSTKIMVK